MPHEMGVEELARLYGPYFHWARGAQHADKSIRLNESRRDLRDLLFRESHNSVDFWRGVLDFSANICLIYQNRYRRDNETEPMVNRRRGKSHLLRLRPSPYWPIALPYFKLNGSPRFLAAFAEWTYLHSAEVDLTATMARQARLGCIILRGPAAQSLVQFYWPNDDVLTVPSNTPKAAEIREWTNSTQLRKNVLDKLIDTQLLRIPAVKKIRLPYAHLLAEVNAT